MALGLPKEKTNKAYEYLKGRGTPCDSLQNKARSMSDYRKVKRAWHASSPVGGRQRQSTNVGVTVDDSGPGRLVRPDSACRGHVLERHVGFGRAGGSPRAEIGMPISH